MTADPRSMPEAMRRHAPRSSVALNLAEGSRRSGRDRARFYAIAHGSAEEGRTALRIAIAKRALTAEQARRADAVMDRQAAMMWKLVRAKR